MLRFAFLAALLVCAMPSTAQTYTSKYSVFGQAGVARIYDDEGSLGTGYYGGGGMGYRFHRRFGAEFEVFRFKHERTTGTLRFAGTGTYYIGDLLFYFSERRIQPYLVGGAGVLHYVNRSNLENRPIMRSTKLAGNAGLGIQAFLHPRVSLHPEARLTWGGATVAGGVEPPISALRFSIGIGYHW